MFREADRAISYVADVEAKGLKAVIETVSQGPRSFFIVHLVAPEHPPDAPPTPRLAHMYGRDGAS